MGVLLKAKEKQSFYCNLFSYLSQLINSHNMHMDVLMKAVKKYRLFFVSHSCSYFIFEEFTTNKKSDSYISYPYT